MVNFRMLKLSDFWLWLAAGILLAFGFLAIFSSTYNLQLKLGGDPFLFVKKQFVSFLFACFGLFFFAYLDYNHLKKISFWFYIFCLILLSLVLWWGEGHGAQRWLSLGLFSFQPSEFSKLSLIVALSAFFENRKRIENFWQAGYLLAMVGLPFFLVFRQPDLGTAIVFGAIFLGIISVSEVSFKLPLFFITVLLSTILRPFFYFWIIYLLLIIVILFLFRANLIDWLLLFGGNLAAGITFPIIWGMLKVYQRQRILSFLNPSADPYGAGYHTLQSKIAIGSGGLWGRGFLRGTQTQLQYIPEQHSDFIFSAIGEELGFLGSMVILFLFLLFFWRSLKVASAARDSFGSLLASGITTMVAFQVLANIGMVSGILPVVGIPLPFVSFGGSSLFVNMTALGILQSISMRRQKIIF